MPIEDQTHGVGRLQRHQPGQPVGDGRSEDEAPQQAEAHEAHVAQSHQGGPQLQPQPHVQQVAGHEDHQRDLQQRVQRLGAHVGAAVHCAWRRHQVQRHREDQVDHQHQHADEPGRAPTDRDEHRGDRGDEHHHHRARPELQIHRRRPDDIAQQHQHRRDEQRDLRRAAQRDAHAQVEPVLARGGKGRGHLGRAADQRDDDEADEDRRHAEVLGRHLHRLDEDLAHQRHQHGDAGQRAQRQAHRPGGFALLARAPALANSSRCVFSENSMPSA